MSKKNMGSIEALEMNDFAEGSAEKIGEPLLLAQLNEKHYLLQWVLAELRTVQTRVSDAMQQFKASAFAVRQATGANVDYLDATTRTHDWNPATGQLINLQQAQGQAQPQAPGGGETNNGNIQ